MTKTIYNCICLLAAALMFASCSDNTMAELFGDTKTVDFKLGNPSWTTTSRAGVAGSDATVSTGKLQLLCFDAGGGFVGVGTIVSTTSATVPASTNKIHFLLNYGTSLTDDSYTKGSNENVIIPTLVTEANESDAVVCWGYLSDLSTYTSSTTIPLIRNVAKVTVAKSSSSISDVKLEVYNDNDHGTVAPLDASNLKEPFNNTINYSDNLPTFVTNPIGVTTARRTKPKTLSFNNDNVFIYECEQTESNPLTVLLKVTYTDYTVKYHKLLLSTKNSSGANELCKLLRNHNYTITLTDEFTSDKGYSSVDEAISNTATNAGGTIITLDNGSLDVGLNGSITLSSSELTLKSTLDNGKESTDDITATVNFTYSGANDPGTFSVSFSESEKVTFSEITYDESTKKGSFTITLPYANGTFNAEATELGTVTLSCSTASASMKVYTQTALNTLTFNTVAFTETGALDLSLTPSTTTTSFTNVTVTCSTGDLTLASSQTAFTADSEGKTFTASSIATTDGKLDLSSYFTKNSTDKFANDATVPTITVVADNFASASSTVDISKYKEASAINNEDGTVVAGENCYFSSSSPTNSGVTIQKTNSSPSFGDCNLTVDGISITQALKMQTGTTITITAGSALKMTIYIVPKNTTGSLYVYSSSDTKDDNHAYSYSNTDSSITVTLSESGTYTIEKKSTETQVAYLKFEAID